MKLEMDFAAADLRVEKMVLSLTMAVILIYFNIFPLQANAYSYFVWSIKYLVNELFEYEIKRLSSKRCGLRRDNGNVFKTIKKNVCICSTEVNVNNDLKLKNGLLFSKRLQVFNFFEKEKLLHGCFPVNFTFYLRSTLILSYPDVLGIIVVYKGQLQIKKMCKKNPR